MAEGGIFAEDIVKNSQGTVGVVLEDAEETTDESDSDEEALKKGQIVVCWYPSGNEETIAISKVKLADRALLPGDVVKFSDVNRGTQKGFVSNVEVAASVKVLVANQIFHNVDCKELSPLQHFIIGAHVSLGPWLGTVTEVYRRVVIMLKNGSRCAIEGPAGEQSSVLFDMSDQRDEDCPFYSPLFYPGQRLTGSARAFKEAKWLSGVKPILNSQSHIKGTVEQVSVIACEVDWQVCGACQQGCNGDECLKPPDLTVTQEQLPRLLVVNQFRHANLQVGDKAFYTVKAHDLRYISNGESLVKEQAYVYDNTEHAYTSPPSDSQTEGCGVHGVQPVNENGNAGIEKNRKTCLVETVTEKGDAVIFEGSCLISEGSTDSFVPETDSKTSSGSTSTSSLCEADPTANTATDTASSQNRQATVNVSETGCGTNQIDINNGHHIAGSDSADADEDSDGGETVTPKTKAPGSSKHDSGSSHVVRYPTKRRKKRLRRKRKTAPPLKVNVGDRVCVEVTNTCTTVDVIWQDGSTQEKILSTDVTPVFHLDELEFFPGDFISDKRENADLSHYGVVLTTDHKSRMCHVKWFSREGQELRDERDVSVYDIMEHTDFVFSAGDVVVRVAKGDSDITDAEGGDRPIPCVGQVTLVDEEGSVFIKWVDKTLSKVKPQELYKIDAENDGHLSTDGSTVESEDEWETASGESSDGEDLPVGIMDLVYIMDLAAAADEGDITADQAGHTTDEGAENVDREAVQETRNRMNEILSNTNPPFMTFDTVPESHTYKYSTFQAQNPGRFLSCMRKEMALLTYSLPAGIIVRGYEDRVDIFRVMITGPVDTPYEHGLFIFDVRLPHDYPASPPLFHYLSQCSGRLNPNLYEDGKVCVSLLGTWAGRGSEVWTSKSNVLQVLVSVQGLILCSEPYYNEAGYEKQRGTVEGRENSRLYNEMVLLKLVQSMERLLRNPPVGLENEIYQHFAHHGARMLRKLKRWIALFHEQATAVPGCDSGETVNYKLKVNELEEKGERSENEHACRNDASNVDVMRAKAASSCVREESRQAHAMSGELVPNQEVRQNEPCSNGVSKDNSHQSAVSSEGKPSNAETQGACQGAVGSEKDIPDYPLFPLSRGFCLSLMRALDSFEAALEKAQLPDCSE